MKKYIALLLIAIGVSGCNFKLGNATETANTGVTASQLLWTGTTPPAWNSVQWGSVQWGSVQWGSVQWGSVQWGSVQWGSDYWGP